MAIAILDLGGGWALACRSSAMDRAELAVGRLERGDLLTSAAYFQNQPRAL